MCARMVRKARIALALALCDLVDRFFPQAWLASSIVRADIKRERNAN